MNIVGSLIININTPKYREIIQSWLNLGYAIKITPFKSAPMHQILIYENGDNDEK